MKGVVFEKQGAEPKVGNIDVPKPGPDQILAKSIYAAMNPVDTMIPMMGLLVQSWPVGLGCDAAGIVVDAGKNAAKKHGFKAGDHVFGCTRPGDIRYATGNEYFLMDAFATMRKPSNITFAQASTSGSALQTSALGLFEGLKLAVPDPKAAPADRNEWVLILGGSGSVGSAGLQLARAAGYNVIASSSPRNFDKVKGLGANAVFNYGDSIEDQLKAVQEATGGNIGLIYDATSSDDPKIAREVFKNSSASTKLFATTNDWSGVPDFEGGKTYEIHLGRLGQDTEDAKPINEAAIKYNPIIQDLLASGRVKTQDYEEIGTGGFEDAIKAWKHKGDGRKVIVKIQDE
ncbi:hypothetical protein M409DRAFT_54266 [Zasmidium cellare ATCC 36951]|uniref:Enoyl reductase (ER) domain-containing protein n=1 Tax=Zasmidium cellare ATCC 36951 TaxID=1080233 RepID=A0A6A6CM99_ZASCE|nr:uncharacterized protein M409DRAFT_54266 [Zasmidium cellare ATCC 36951]KAF2167052.1 hypothetical protein M409DRAFT_54266 [Zasmidium cellare ATCC 36951]